MAEIKPRWEWRTFGTRFARAEAAFAKMETKGVQETDEIYLLTEKGSNVKIRAGLLDIKVLQKVNEAGLEQWMPVMKEGFPARAATVREVFKAMQVTPPDLKRDDYTLDQFLAELIEASNAVRAANVHKRRVRYVVGGCTSELSDVTVDGIKTRTIAVETEDAAAVVAAVESLGLSGYVNTNYSRGLAATLSGKPPRYAVIDVGTNSVKFHIAEAGGNGKWKTVADRAELTRLGEGLKEGGSITKEAAERTASAVKGMVDDAHEAGCLGIAAAGTAGLRIARNSAEVLEIIRAKTGVKVEVVSGDEEGRLAYLAVRAGLPLAKGSLVVFDTGGGSSQFTFGHGDQVSERFSVNVGAVRYTERYKLDGAVSGEVLREAMTAIAEDLSRIDGRPQPDTLVAMGGAVTNLTAVSYSMAKYDPDKIQGTVLERAEIDRQIQLYRTTPLDKRAAIVGIQPKRADVILAGACIVRTVMEKLGKHELTVSDRGLRHGLLLERFG
jgi:exopolyphosphatase / guanosine-5'-triphosphate,3'-diphosphate pyrophosphatase